MNTSTAFGGIELILKVHPIWRIGWIHRDLLLRSSLVPFCSFSTRARTAAANKYLKPNALFPSDSRARIGVEKSASHHLPQPEIASDNP